MKAKVCYSRKSTASIMNHGGFGDLTVTKHGVTVFVPRSYLFGDGRIKKYAQKMIDKTIDKYLMEMESEREVG